MSGSAGRGIARREIARRCRRDDEGSATVEYGGAVFVVVALMIGLVGTVTPISAHIMARICAAVGADCSSLVPEQRARDLNIPCIIRQADRSLGYNVSVEFVRGDRKDTDQIKVNADGSASVTLTQGAGIGLEAAKGGGSGPSGSARATVNGDAGYVYNFPAEWGGEEAAQRFLDDRRSGLNTAIDIVVPGAQTIREGANQAGHGIANAWDWATEKLGHGPSAAERARQARDQSMTTPDAVLVALSLQGSLKAGYDSGVMKAEGELSGQVKGQATVALNESGADKATTLFTGSAQYDLKGSVTLGASDQPGSKGFPPIFNIGGGFGQTVSYTVKFDEDGEPVALVLTTETRYQATGGLAPTTKVGGGSTKVGGKATGLVGNVDVSTTTLDLTSTENRSAFDQVFDVYSVDVGEANARVADLRLDSLPLITSGWDALQARLDADGFEADYHYANKGDTLSGSGGEKAAKAGGWGVGGESTETERTLLDAVSRDNRSGGAEAVLATCEQ